MNFLLRNQAFSLKYVCFSLGLFVSGVAHSECQKKDIGFYDVDDNCRCDQKAKPWLDNECRRPEPYNPNHACRIAAYIEHHGGNPLDRNLVETLHVESEILNLAWMACDDARKNKCMDVELVRHQSYMSIVTPFFGEQKGDASLDKFNVHSIFSQISDKNLKIQTQLDELSDRIASKVATISSKSDSKNAVRALYTEMQPIRSSLAELSKLEERLDIALSSVVSKLSQLEYMSLYAKLGFDCKKYLSESSARYASETKDLFELINKYRTATQSQRKATNKLYNQTYYSWTFAAYKKYAEAVGQTIDAATDDLNRDIKLDNLLWQFDDWWVETSVNGLAGNMHTRYYYYTEPLRILTIKKEEAEDFKDRIRSFEKIEKPVSDKAIQMIDSKIVLIQKDIDWIKSKGWQGLMSLQRLSAEKRASLLPQNQKCQALTAAFIQKINTVKSLSDFDSISPMYKDTVTTCVK